MDSAQPPVTSKRPLAPYSPHRPQPPPVRRRLQQRHAPPPVATAVDAASILQLFSQKLDAITTAQNDIKDQQTKSVDALKTHFDEHVGKLAQQTATLQSSVAAHAERLDENDQRHVELQSKIDDLATRFSNFEEMYRSTPTLSQSSTSSSTSFSYTPTSTRTLAFPDKVGVDLAARIASAKEYHESCANSFVIFDAQEYLLDRTPEIFAQIVANLFGGGEAKVDKVTWIGVGKTHLKVTLVLPLAEAIGASFYRNRQTYGVSYSLAPCRSKLLRDGMSRMRQVFLAIRNRMPELLPARMSATSISFLDRDVFDAFDFLYPAVRLSDNRIIPTSIIVNSPLAPTLELPIDPTLNIPAPKPFH
jgi:hypothetical protein